MPVTVQATEAEVRSALEGELSAEELAQLGFEPADGGSDAAGFSPAPRRAEPVTTTTLLIWVISGIAGGAAYDATKLLAKKVRDILARKLGRDRVDDAGE